MVTQTTIAAMELREASKNLCEDITDASKTGNVLEVVSLLKKYNDNPTQYDSDAFGGLITNAFWRSCEYGHVECTKKLHGLMLDRKERLGYGLEAACIRGHANIVKFLIPILKLEECLDVSKTLMKSIRGGSIYIVKMVLPHVKNRVTRTKGLREACKYNNQAVFDLLYPLSNPQSALDFMEKSNAPGIEMLRDEMARQQRVVLSEAVGEVSAKPVRKNKI